MENQTPLYSQNQNPPPQPGSKWKTWVIAGLAALLLAAGGIIWYLATRPAPVADNYLEDNYALNGRPNSGGQATTTDVTTSTSSPVVTTDPNVGPQGAISCTNMLPPAKSKSGLVEWSNPKQLENANMFADKGNGIFASEQDFLVGKFKGGKYAGADILISIVQYNEPGPAVWYRVVRQGGRYVVLGKYSDEWRSEEVRVLVPVEIDNDFSLTDLDVPLGLRSENPKADFQLAPSSGFFRNGNEFFCSDGLQKVFTDASTGDVYTDQNISRNGFYVRMADGSQRAYVLTIPIVDGNRVPLITWSDGKKNNTEYAFQAIGGCGATNFRDVLDISESGLVQIGTALDGSAVFGYKDTNNQELKDMYDGMYVPEGKQKISYAAFLASHPIFFWKDPFGKFVRFKSRDYQPMAECGKPVIYLYPEKTQNVSVKLYPVGGFSHTEPAYGSGWNVIAHPDGKLVDKTSGKTYPYLFWEGNGGLYETPKKGFTVAQADVHGFLIDKLHQHGLNDKESADFMEFWEPKMQGSPYYFVTFMGNSVMDTMAPLSVTPKPDTVIRVLMDFLPLDHYVASEGYPIRTPVRKGFTVVEWGGVIRNDK